MLKNGTEAKDKELMGVERKSMIITEDEKRSTAFHEAGHVLVAKLIPESDPVHKVTIIPRGRALGVTSYLPIDERHSYSKKILEIRLVHLLGGRVAEKLVYNHFTTGAGNDIERATELARKMVCEWGMSDELGPLAFGKESEEIFIGREIARSKNYSEQTALLIDSETSRIVKEASDRAEKLIKENMKKLHSIAEALLIYETLDGNEIDQIFNGKTLKTKSGKAASSAKSSDNSGDGKSQKKQATGTTRRKKKVAEESKTEDS